MPRPVTSPRRVFMGLVPLQVGGIEPHATGLLDGHAHEKLPKLPTILLFYVGFSLRYSVRIEFSREYAVGTGDPSHFSLSHSTSSRASAASVEANSPRECLAVISAKAKCLEVGRPAVPVLTASIAPQTSAAAGSGFQFGGGSMPSAHSHSIAIARGTQQLLIK